MWNVGLKKYFKEDFTVHLVALIVFGFFLLFISTTGIPYIISVSRINEENSKFFFGILTSVKPILELFSYILMGIGSIVYSTKKIARVAWQTSAEVAFEKIYSTVNNNMDDISLEIGKISKNVHGFIRDLEKPITIGECKNREEFKYFAMRGNRGVYGPHIDHKESLYSFVESRILDPFCCLPHPSTAKKRITIKRDTEKDDYLLWEEHTRYKIHHVKYALTKSDEVYRVVYGATSYAPNLNIEEWAKCLSLKITVNGDARLRPDSTPKFEKNSKDDGFFCWKINDWIHFRFQENITLSEEWADVEILEKSINFGEDKTFSLNASRPIYGYEIDLVVPEGYAVADNPFVSPFMAYGGLPEFAKKEVERYYREPRQDSENHINIDIRGWILPGIITTLNWSPK